MQPGPWCASPLVAPRTTFDLVDNSDPDALAEFWYAEAVRLDGEGSAAAVDAYLQCALATWPAVEMIGSAIQVDPSLESPTTTASVQSSRERELYHASVAGMLSSAQNYGRWNSATGFVAATPQGPIAVETAYHGFPWEPIDFGVLHSFGGAPAAQQASSRRRPGVGVPLIVVRNAAAPPRPFVPPARQFAATALVRPVMTAAGPAMRIEFYDPQRESQVRLGAVAVPLAADISAPLGRPGQNVRQAWLEPFLRPSAEGAADRLEMLEPYQPGKIPVLFIHGLLSDPLVWRTMVNELQAQPALISRYQLWTFRYDTGAPFLTSAAALRRQLVELQTYYDPCGYDGAAPNIIVVGHSMGGLVAKLQVTYSGAELWNAEAHIPLEQVRTDSTTRALLNDAFFFAPSPRISRVIYIGTPHLGSGMASRLVGRLGSALVEPAPQAAERHEQVIRDNPGAFSEEFTRRLPTSIDLLEPTSPLLLATSRLPYRPGVQAHSIIGEGSYTVGSGPSDGVVPLCSARLRGVTSEKLVAVRHARQPGNEAVIAEVMRILVHHAQAADATTATPAYPVVSQR
jgi:pimeloyl-ACP methyl ester carboxylesterase